MLRRVVTVVLLAAVFACGTPQGAPVRVIVPKGASFSTATDSLDRAGLVSAPVLFKLYARVTGNDRSIKPGTYLFRRGTPWNSILDALHGGKGLVNTVTIPEGFALAQITPLLARTLNVPVESVTAATHDTALLARLRVPTPALEGYLFPDTYAFPDGTSARAAVLELVRRFEREWKPAWDTQLSARGLDRHRAVTLASIVEREARVGAERPVIAGVYYNRLKAGMLLQADPTVQYARGTWVPRLLLKDLEVDSPYNTYRYAGLPPGPIASPGAASLRAAVFPAETPYLYFVARPDGRHEFSRTLAQHDSIRRMIRRDSALRTARTSEVAPVTGR